MQEQQDQRSLTRRIFDSVIPHFKHYKRNKKTTERFKDMYGHEMGLGKILKYAPLETAYAVGLNLFTAGGQGILIMGAVAGPSPAFQATSAAGLLFLTHIQGKLAWDVAAHAEEKTLNHHRVYEEPIRRGLDDIAYDSAPTQP